MRASGNAFPPDVSVEHLTLRHIGRRAPALRDLSLRWSPGERLLLLGPSGSGKSTLALCLNGVIPHSLEAHWDAGRILVDGQDTRQLGAAGLASRTGVLFQDAEAQLVMLEVDDEIAFGLENQGRPRQEMRQRIAAARVALGLDPQRTPARLDALSGGAKQRVTLASLLAMGPSAIVADEPTANLDPAGARLAFRLLATAAAGRSLLLIEHRLDDLAGLIDRVAVLDGEGHLALQGTPATVFGAQAHRLRALGVWTPQYADLARLPGLHALGEAEPPPATAGAAADLLVRRWPAAPAGATAVPPAGQAPLARPLLSLREASYRYPGARQPAVQGVTLDVAPGEFVALVGPNGAGKSTLGLLLAGVVRPDAGRTLLDGRDIGQHAERDVRRRLGYVFQYPEHQFAASTVRADVLVGLQRASVDPAHASQRADEVLQRFGLAALAAASPYSLSHGQKRRLSVASTLVVGPELLILDEPTFGQDRRHVEEMLDLLSALHRQGRTVVVITHDMTLVAERAQRAVAVAAGKVVFDGAPVALFARPDVLHRCRLRRPPIAAAVWRARRRRPNIPWAISLPDLAAQLDAARRVRQ